MSDSSFGTPRYGITRRLPGVTFEQALARAREALPAEGFGVLTEIDVQATLKKKIGVERAPYVILGACNPALANEALGAEAAIGLLLPCNVVVALDPDGTPVVSAVDPEVMFEVVGRDDVRPLAAEVRARLARVIEAL